jgi:tricorn protease-like protein
MRLILASTLLLSICVGSLAARTPSASLKTIAIRVSEGTTLSFDLSPDGRWIVFDLLGQLWIIPTAGGNARPITNAVHDIAEDLDPSFSPDGRRVVFRGERNGRIGLWLLNPDSGVLRQLTQLSDPDGYEGNASWSPDGRVIAFARALPPGPTGGRGRTAIMLLDVASGTTRELSITGLPQPNVSDPIWVRGGSEIMFVTRSARGPRPGRIWLVPAAGGQAKSLTDESVQALAPSIAASQVHRSE